MSGEPSLDLQEAIVGVLRGTGVAGGRVYDSVPSNVGWPYVSYGPEQVLSDDADCLTGYEVFVQLDVWTKTVGRPEMKRVAGDVRAALHNASLTLDNHTLVTIEHRQTRYLDDPQVGVRHAAMEFRALVDSAE